MEVTHSSLRARMCSRGVGRAVLRSEVVLKASIKAHFLSLLIAF